MGYSMRMDTNTLKEDLREAVSSILAAAAAADAREWKHAQASLADAVSHCSRVMDELAREAGSSGRGSEDAR